MLVLDWQNLSTRLIGQVVPREARIGFSYSIGLLKTK